MLMWNRDWLYATHKKKQKLSERFQVHLLLAPLVSLEMAANFRLFLNVAIFLKGKMLDNSEDWIIFLILTNSKIQLNVTLFWWITRVQYLTVNWFTREGIIFLNNSTFVYPIYTFSLKGNINVCTPSQYTNREKYFNNINHKERIPTLAGNKHLFMLLFPHWPRFSISRRKKYGPNRSAMDIEVLIPAPTQ